MEAEAWPSECGWTKFSIARWGHDHAKAEAMMNQHCNNVNGHGHCDSKVCIMSGGRVACSDCTLILNAQITRDTYSAFFAPLSKRARSITGEQTHPLSLITHWLYRIKY